MPQNDLSPAPSRTEHTVDGTTVVELRGEIDIRTAPSLAFRLEALTAAPHPDVVLDLRSTAFIDCAGLGVLCRARNRAEARQGRLRLVTDSASFRRILRNVGLAGAFELHSDLDTALAGTPRASTAR
ncbi:STAS domain-containing protein [Streptomyces djakartensis]|uniref:Anti-sigma factor antagonist n=1 Tax=Streptomyces djakartensis TaxID=68193 RepID=A0ABQ2ZH78_9ACTN|nr:STAS domain-containing protein [Streptomyces djakartensis]GGY15102.1 anti-sigma factor antagonist [Streptomyces djakartensis]